MLKAVNPPREPVPGGYSQAVEATGTSRMLFISGLVGVTSEGVVPPSVGEQTRIAVGRVRALLEQAGMTTANLVKLTIYLTDAAHVPEFVAAASGSVTGTPPATTLLIVKALAVPSLLVEIEGMAVA
jgi:enamine deaminase RidA (YjgF/YER057c/UK114 family)